MTENASGMQTLDALHWEMFLRGAVAGLLAFHLVQLALHRARPAARLALGAFTASVLAYLFCQQAELLLNLPRPLTLLLMALCVGTTAWMWAAARALFDDDFRFSRLVVSAIVAMTALGLAANLPYLPEGDGPFVEHAPDSAVAWLNRLHAAAMLAFTAAALWEVGHGWRDDLVATRRAARRWVAMGIGLYAALALVVELALRGQTVGRLLPALHVAGIGLVALGLAVVVARRSLDEILGRPDARAEARAVVVDRKPAAAAEAPTTREGQALSRLTAAMTEGQLYRVEGLTLAALAEKLGLGEAALRELINQRLGYRNFNDFLHHHRLQEAQVRLANEDLPILTIALECGYGSIGPFNRAFRQRTGMTPSEFRGASRLAKGPATH